MIFKFLNSRSLCLLLVGSMMVLSAEGKNIEFYVSPAGNDMNPGTKKAPFKSLGKAKESVRTQFKKSPGKSVVVSI
ncbi:MAG TPA: hypothetical protein VN249_09650, partial [Prolixibacteraceae bacterium]|nr:hypothetical protein [Prolixibacteraceae bacterium]